MVVFESMASSKVLAIGAPVALAGCGNADTTGGDSHSTDELPATTVAEQEPELLASCGTVRFSSIPADVDEFQPVDAETQAIVDDTSLNHGSNIPDHFKNFDWRVVKRSESRLVFLGIGLALEQEPPYFYMTFEQVNGDWKMVGQSGDCQIQVSAEGFSSAEVVLDPDVEPDPASAELAVLINERECASGRPPVDRSIVPVVDESEAAIEITVLVEPSEGDVNCEGNPWHAITIELEAPWNRRTVYDARSQPPTERFWPPQHSDFDDG